MQTLFFQRCALLVLCDRSKTRVIRLRVIESPNGLYLDCVLRIPFILSIPATYLLRMCNSNMEIRIAGSSGYPHFEATD